MFKINIFTIICTIICAILHFSSINCGKTAKKSNVIAVFSEDDLSDKLPKPENVAAEIPKHLIFKESKKLKAVVETPSKREDLEGDRNSFIARSVNVEKSNTVTKSKKSKSKKKKSDDVDSFDRKSKSMIDIDESYDIVEPFILVDTATISTPVATNVNIPTASIVTITATSNIIAAENIQIAKIDATSQYNTQEVFTVHPQKVRQFTPRSRMYVNRANSSAKQSQPIDFKTFLAVSFISLFIIHI